ncbi:hypothetical protein [Geoglobus acetivorans]|uniref:Uncharacterized protein n=1 Tax=Geoglobus acetivorans TaxID=565033 RepID=A0A0A7GEE9_GEOAI|nr:hypothetical protein GACE_1378 [Geoglobus acetivorans]
MKASNFERFQTKTEFFKFGRFWWNERRPEKILVDIPYTLKKLIRAGERLKVTIYLRDATIVKSVYVWNQKTIQIYIPSAWDLNGDEAVVARFEATSESTFKVLILIGEMEL